MAGKIIADTIEASGSQISLNVGNVTILTASSSGLTLTPTNNVNINVTNSTLAFGAGNVSFPSITASGDTNTGLYFPAADTIGFVEGGTEVMRINSSGNVGIGTASPTYGTLEVAQGSAGVVSVINNTVGAWAFRKVRSDGSNGMGIYDASGFGVPAFYASGSERMRIDSSGRLLVGTTSENPGYGNTNTGAQISGTGSTFSRSAVDYVMVLNQNTVDGTSYYQINFRVGNVAKGSIISTASATAYNTSSDYRLKENIAPMTGALAKVTQLKPVTYKWKEDGSDGEGFIAHELAEVKPDCVTGEKYAVDENGDIKPQGIDTSFLVATLTAAIQELKVIVDAQAVEIAALKAK